MPQCTICLRTIQTITKRHLATKVCQAARAHQQISKYAEDRVKCIVKETRMRQFEANLIMAELEELVDEFKEGLEFLSAEPFVPEVIEDDQLHLVLQNKVSRGALTTKGKSARATVLFANSDLMGLVFGYLYDPIKYDVREFFRIAMHSNIGRLIPYSVSRIAFDPWNMAHGTLRRRNLMIRAIPVDDLRAMSSKLEELETNKCCANLTHSILRAKIVKTPEEQLMLQTPWTIAKHRRIHAL